jgi:hypothetical protein
MSCNDWYKNRGSEEEKHEPEPVLSFARLRDAFQRVKSFFYAHNIGERDENILNMEMALFALKHKVSMKQSSMSFFIKTSDLHTGIKITFFIYYFFDLSEKYNILILCCSFLIFLCFHATIVFTCLLFFSPSPFGNDG